MDSAWRAGIRFVLLPFLMVLAGFTAAGGQPWERAGTFVEDAAPQPVDDLTGRCPAPPAGICAYGDRVLRRSCEVRKTRELGVFGGDQYLLVTYLRSKTFDEGGGRGPYACSADEIALVALGRGGRARVVWRDATEREFVFISSARLSSYADGTTVLAILYCMNGTGGCAQGILIWTGGAWRKLTRDASWDAVYRNLPAGYRPHKSPEIDLGNLTWEQHLAHRDDPNCCPSGKIFFDLSIVGDRLAVKSYRIVVPDKR